MELHSVLPRRCLRDWEYNTHIFIAISHVLNVAFATEDEHDGGNYPQCRFRDRGWMLFLRDISV